MSVSLLRHGIAASRLGAVFRWETGDTLASAVRSRASTAYYVDENGTLQSAAADEMRDAQHIGGIRHLLIEGQRTNGWTWSEQLDNAAYSKSGVTVAANATAAPDGSATADKLLETATNEKHYFARAAPALTDNTPQAVSVYLKAAGRSVVRLVGVLKDGLESGADFNLSTGTLTAYGGGTGSMTALADGWYHCSLVYNCKAGAGTPSVLVQLQSGSVYLGDGASGVYVWGLEFEADQPSASSYIKTEASTVTRAADLLNFPFSLPPVEMTLYAKFTERGTIEGSSGRVLFVGSGAETGRQFAVWGGTSGGKRYRCYHSDGTSAVSDNSLATAPAIGDLVELRAVLHADGSVHCHQSINEGAETSGVRSSAKAMGATWGDTKIWIGNTTAVANGFNAFRGVKVQRGVKTLADMRAA